MDLYPVTKVTGLSKRSVLTTGRSSCRERSSRSLTEIFQAGQMSQFVGEIGQIGDLIVLQVQKAQIRQLTERAFDVRDVIVPGVEFSQGEVAPEKVQILQIIVIDGQATQPGKDLQRGESADLSRRRQREREDQPALLVLPYRLFKWRRVTSFLFRIFFLEI